MNTKLINVPVQNPFIKMGRGPEMGCPLGWVEQWCTNVRAAVPANEVDSVVVHGFDTVHATYEHTLTREEAQAEQIANQATMIQELTTKLDAWEKGILKLPVDDPTPRFEAAMRQVMDDKNKIAEGRRELQSRLDATAAELSKWQSGKVRLSETGEVVRSE